MRTNKYILIFGLFHGMNLAGQQICGQCNLLAGLENSRFGSGDGQVDGGTREVQGDDEGAAGVDDFDDRRSETDGGGVLGVGEDVCGEALLDDSALVQGDNGVG